MGYLGVAVERIIKEYEEEIGKKPTMGEILSILEFVCGPEELT